VGKAKAGVEIQQEVKELSAEVVEEASRFVADC